MIKKVLCALFVYFASVECSYSNDSWLDRQLNYLYNDIAQIYCEHDYDIYVPFHAWHNRLFYDKEHIESYNEDTLGFGFGFSHFDTQDNWSGLYAMGFEDSNNYMETFFGYGKQWNLTFGNEHQWRAGAGYTIGLTQRHEYSYVPFPLALPIVGMGYRWINLQAAYVPGIKNDGNVLFIFSRFQFKL